MARTPVKVLSEPPRDAHVAACGLFCTNCGSFKKGRCQGCQVKPCFASCPVRACCESKGILNCSDCGDFKIEAELRDCKKLNNFIAKAFSLVFGSNRPAALALLREKGRDAYLEEKRRTGKM